MQNPHADEATLRPVVRLADPTKTGTAGAPENVASRFQSWAHSPVLAKARDAMLPPLRATYRTPWPSLPHRNELAHLLNARRLLGTGAEVGVRDGFFSEVLLSIWRGRLLLSIDAWREFGTDEYLDRSNVAQTEHDNNLKATRDRLERYGTRSQVHKALSVEFAETLMPASLDFAYLDARHDFEGVTEDLEAWADKVRPGGILCGHDYVDGFFLDGDFGVKTAVDTFFGARGWKVRSTWGDPPWVSWYVFVPPR